jgi:thiosulfate reductase / polysulfide reductase chain A
MDDYAKEVRGRYLRIDKAGSAEWPMAGTMMQETAPNHLKGDPYKLDTAMFYLHQSDLDGSRPEGMGGSPQGRVHDRHRPRSPVRRRCTPTSSCPTTPTSSGCRMPRPIPSKAGRWRQLRVPAVEPVYDTKHYGDTLIEIGKRIRGRWATTTRPWTTSRTCSATSPRASRTTPATTACNDFESWKAKGVWYRKPYHWRQFRGEFYEWDGQGLQPPDDARGGQGEADQDALRASSSSSPGSSRAHADYIQRKKLGIPVSRAGLIQWVEPTHSGGGDLHFVTPKTPMHAEGRSGNLPHAIALMQPSLAAAQWSTSRSIPTRPARGASATATGSASARTSEPSRPTAVSWPRTVPTPWCCRWSTATGRRAAGPGGACPATPARSARTSPIRSPVLPVTTPARSVERA